MFQNDAQSKMYLTKYRNINNNNAEIKNNAIAGDNNYPEILLSNEQLTNKINNIMEDKINEITDFKSVEIYVDNIGSDINGDGSKENPYKTIDKALKKYDTISHYKEPFQYPYREDLFSRVPSPAVRIKLGEGQFSIPQSFPRAYYANTQKTLQFEGQMQLKEFSGTKINQGIITTPIFWWNITVDVGANDSWEENELSGLFLEYINVYAPDLEFPDSYKIPIYGNTVKDGANKVTIYLASRQYSELGNIPSQFTSGNKFKIYELKTTVLGSLPQYVQPLNNLESINNIVSCISFKNINFLPYEFLGIKYFGGNNFLNFINCTFNEIEAMSIRNYSLFCCYISANKTGGIFYQFNSTNCSFSSCVIKNISGISGNSAFSQVKYLIGNYIDNWGEYGIWLQYYYVTSSNYTSLCTNFIYNTTIRILNDSSISLFAGCILLYNNYFTGDTVGTNYSLIDITYAKVFFSSNMFNPSFKHIKVRRLAEAIMRNNNWGGTIVVDPYFYEIYDGGKVFRTTTQNIKGTIKCFRINNDNNRVGNFGSTDTYISCDARIPYIRNGIPNANNDCKDSALIGHSFLIGDIWIDNTNPLIPITYICLSAIDNNAIWKTL